MRSHRIFVSYGYTIVMYFLKCMHQSSQPFKWKCITLSVATLSHPPLLLQTYSIHQFPAQLRDHLWNRSLHENLAIPGFLPTSSRQGETLILCFSKAVELLPVSVVKHQFHHIACHVFTNQESIANFRSFKTWCILNIHIEEFQVYSHSHKLLLSFFRYP